MRYVCASPAYIAARGLPKTVEDLRSHDWIAMRGPEGRVIPIQLSRDGETARAEPRTKVISNEALTQFRLVCGGAGIAVLSGYLVAPKLRDGSLVHLLPDWRAPSIEVNMIFPSKREMAPAIRAFVDFMSEITSPDVFWQFDPLKA